MANNCLYSMKAVSASRDALDRLVKIMKYEDPEYCLYRVFSAEAYNAEKKGDLNAIYIDGDVAWSPDPWFNPTQWTVENDGKTEPPDADGKRRTVRMVTFRELCPILGIGVEVFGSEVGCEFQCHQACSPDGRIIVDDTERYTEEWEDEDGNPLDDPVCSGGLPDYGMFHSANWLMATSSGQPAAGLGLAASPEQATA